MRIDEIILFAKNAGSSDIHISAGEPIIVRTHGELERQRGLIADGEQIPLIESMMSESHKKAFAEGHDVDFSYQSEVGVRLRVNVYRYQGGISATLRLLSNSIPTLEELGLPDVLYSLAMLQRGLVLVTGPTGSGKSTTLAAMIDYVNANRAQHIITIEDPVEYVYSQKKAMIHQREVGADVPSFAYALRSALREDPDIILVGEMRDYETISAALTAAETGHLVLSTLHTTGAALTIDRIVDACPGESQNQVRIQLAGVLKGVITQCLIPLAGGGGRVPATEVLLGSDAVMNMIRENKGHQLQTAMQSGMAQGMHTLNTDLSRLLNANKITRENALRYSNDPKELQQYIL